MKFDIAAVAILAAIAGVIWVALAPLRIWHVTGSDGQQHPDAATWVAYGIGGAVIIGCLMFFSIRSSAKAAGAARRKASLTEGIRIADLLAPERPPCRHPRAVKVNSSVPGLDLTWRCWCPDCGTALPAVFRYPCCGGEPGTLPGDGHAYNCPRRAVKP